MNHVHLGTRDLKKSVAFYSDLFGFKKKFSHGDQDVFLENADGFLLAIDVVPTIIEFPSWFHLGFCVSSENEVREIFARANAMHVKMATEFYFEAGEYASFYMFDPDGYRVEVSWHNE